VGYFRCDGHKRRSFSEHLAFTTETREAGSADIASAFGRYLRLGGMPGVHEISGEASALTYLRDVLDGIVLKDVVARHRIRDLDLLQRLVAHLMDGIGRVVSPKRVSDFLKSQRRSLGTETIYNYLSALGKACLILTAPRHDIKGRRNLETLEKYFLIDHGFIHALLGFRADETPGLLENTVFLELKRRGFDPRIDKWNGKEIDFVADRPGERIYIQVCYLLASPEIVAREFAPLEAVRDNHRKLVLSMDAGPASSRDGIERRHLPEFLLHEGW
jgi:predicted AAA+ superfamily ATPase